MRSWILPLAFAAAAASCDGGILVEAESFAEKGGWSVDAQHMLEMGSPYLLAHGIGSPVADATTEVISAEGGDFFVWVRTRNWTAPWSPHPAGLFRVAVNGRELEFDFGAGSGEWRWVKAPSPVRLNAGANMLSLRDLTGFDGRVDALFLASRGETPPDRAKAACLPPSSTVHADLVVVGGGVAGVCAALTAARSGLRVALVQDRPVLGGNNSSEVRVHLGGHQQCGRYPHLGDVVAEIGPDYGGNARPAEVYEDDRKLAAVRRERGISLFLRTKAVRVEKGSADTISAVVGKDVETGSETRFEAPLFCDATGDGTVGFLAGADFRMGRESRAETGESKAPERADSLTMGASCQWLAAVSASPAPFPRRPWMIRLDQRTATHALRGDWDWETGLGRDQVADAERIRDYGMLVAYSNWAFLKNESAEREDFADKRLDWVAYVAGKRESRRLLGDVVLTDEDVRKFKPYPDGTCLASWSIDLHYPKTAEETGFAGESFRSKCEQEKIALYPIPYRCLYSRNVSNLFMAGRDISVTHNALGTVRVMRTTGMMGEVVGMAAAVCRERGCGPREVYSRHFDDLVRRMEKGAGAGLRQSAQDYNVHPSLGLDLSDKEAVRRQSREEWGTVNLFRGDDGKVFRRQEVSPTLKDGAFTIGHAYARILCFAKDRPHLETGRTPSCGTPRELVPSKGRPGVWETPQMVSFDFCRVRGDVADVRFEVIAAKPFPVDRDGWRSRFSGKKAEIAALRGKVDLVFMGDSLTHIWENRCPDLLADLRRDFTVLNLGYSGDRIENLLWRIVSGEAVNYKAKCIMLEIGTNNSRNGAEEIAAGIRKVLNKLMYAQPQAKILLLPVFPRRDSGDGKPHARPVHRQVNEIIREFADGEQVIWLDFADRFLDEDGDTLWCMPDRLHPQTEGMRIWFENVLPVFRRICGKGEPVRTAGWPTP